jgi:hypothetical protein
MSLAFDQTAGSITVSPPTSTEVTIASTSIAVVVGNRLKIDFAVSYDIVTTANYNFTCESRLYRDGVLINTRTINRIGTQAGTQRFPVSNTYIDTAVATTTSTYQIRGIITAATNVTSTNVVNRNLNIINLG